MVESAAGVSAITLGSAASIVGNRLSNSAGAGSASTIGLLGGMSGAAAYTMLAIATPSSLTTRMPLLGYDWYSGIPYWGFGTGYGDSSKVFAYLDTSNYVVETTSGFFVAGERHLYAMTASGPDGVTFYKDKTASVGTIGGSFVNAPAIPAQSLSVGGGSLGGGTAWEGTIELVAYWNRVLSAFEIARIVDNPWQLFEADNDPVFYTLATGGTTVAVPAGALTLTGYAPTVSFTAHQTIAVPAGALTLTGFAPTVSTSAAQTIAVPAASLTLTGFAPTVAATANQSISVPAGSLTLTGYAPTVYTTAVTTIAVPAGTLTLTGYAPTVSYTTHAYIGVPAGALTLTGYAPTVIGGTSSIWTPASASSGTWTPASASGGTWTPQ